MRDVKHEYGYVCVSDLSLMRHQTNMESLLLLHYFELQ